MQRRPVAAITGHTDMRTLQNLREVDRQRLARQAITKRVAAGGF